MKLKAVKLLRCGAPERNKCHVFLFMESDSALACN